MFFRTGWSRRRQPTRRRVRQRPPSAGRRPAEDSRDGPERSAALRHLTSAPGIPRMCFKNSQQVSNSHHAEEFMVIHNTRGLGQTAPSLSIIIERKRRIISLIGGVIRGR